MAQICLKCLLRIAGTWGEVGWQSKQGCCFSVLLGVWLVSPPSLSSPASITSVLPRQSPPDQPRRPAVESPPKHKSSSKVQGTLQLALWQPTPWASRGTGQGLHPRPWLLLLQWVPDGLGLGGRLRSLPDFTRAVVRSSDPGPGHHA